MENLIVDAKNFNKVYRQFHLIGLLLNQSYQKEDLLDAMYAFYGVYDLSVRTIERDIESLQQFWGIQVDAEQDRKQNKRLFISFEGKTELYKMLIEIMLTYLFKDNLIQQSLEPIIRNVDNPFTFFTTLYKAISEKRHITFDYYFENRDAWNANMDLEPYDLFNRSGRWLLIGYSDKNPDVKQYFIHNIKNLRINYNLPQFTVKSHLYDKDEYYKYAWGVWKGDKIEEIQIWFSQKVATKVKNYPHHETQTVTETEDGIILSLKCWGYIEVVNWVLGFGKEAKVLNPAECVKYIEKLLLETLRNYKH